jgi:hypothetical protein
LLKFYALSKKEAATLVAYKILSMLNIGFQEYSRHKCQWELHWNSNIWFYENKINTSTQNSNFLCNLEESFNYDNMIIYIALSITIITSSPRLAYNVFQISQL